MTTTETNEGRIPTKYSLPLLLALIAVGLAGNYFKYPIFLNIDFLFGSIFAMLALQFFGLGRGIVAAAMIASYTYILWNHPYAIIIMTAEVAVVGLLMTRRKFSMVVADTLYWLFVGMPLVYLLYHLVMHVPPSNVYFTMTKQAMNGIANALVARLIFSAVLFRSHSQLISLREIISNLFVLFIMLQSLSILAIASRSDFAETDGQIRSNLIQAGISLNHFVATWLNNRKTTIVNLAEMAVTRSPQQMQPYLEQTKHSDTNFLRVGLLNREATITAYFPLIDELGQKNIGKNFADRPYISLLKQTRKPMLSEVVIAKIGTPKPMVSMLAPLVVDGEYRGYAIGVLNMEQIREQLDKSLAENATLYTLLDKNGNVIMSNRTDQKVMTPIERGKGSLNRLDKDVSQWIPTLPPNIPISERWKKSFYVTETSLGDLAEWKLILEQPVAPFQKKLYDNYTSKLMVLFLILLFVMVLAELLSRQAMLALDKLRLITIDLPARLASDSKEIVWPVSRIKETNHLIRNFMAMADTLAEQKDALLRSKDDLEQKVEERTTELKRSENMFRTLFNQMPIPLSMSDASGNIIFQNQSFTDAFGYTLQDLPTIATWMMKAYPDEQYRTAVIAIWSESVSDAVERQAVITPKDYTVTCKDGSVRTVSISGTELGDGKLLVIFVDVTERKQAEATLMESELRFRSLMEDIPSIAVQGYTLDGTVLFWNRASERLYGYRAEEALKSNLLDLIIPEEMKAGVTGAVHQMIETGEPIPAGELLLKRKDGSRVPVFSSHALVTPVGRQPELFCLDIDLTEQKSTEEQLHLAKTAAESANTAKSQFLANMSHEIRTPMNGVLGMTQLLEMTELTAEQRQYTASLNQCGKNLMSLINDILDLSKIEAGKFDIVLADFSLHHCISDVVLMQKTAAFEKRLTLDLNLSTEIPPLLVGDQLRIKQILLNLLGNAVKFTAQGHVTLSTQLLEQHDTVVLIRIAVHDTGIGISPEALESIFKPFTQEDGSISRKYGGTGLGLTISLRLAELLGGTIDVESSPGVGSCFTVTLPFSVSRECTTIQTAPTATVGWDGPPLRILFAEDDQVNIKFGASLLKKMGHDVTVVENGRECLTALEQGTFDLVLMDIQMPVMNGEEALRAIRSNEQGTASHQPVIALTAYSMRGDMEQFLVEGFDGYVSKPLTTGELISELKRTLGET